MHNQVYFEEMHNARPNLFTSMAISHYCSGKAGDSIYANDALRTSTHRYAADCIAIDCYCCSRQHILRPGISGIYTYCVFSLRPDRLTKNRINLNSTG